MTGTDMIAEERLRQVFECGYTPESDDAHTAGELLECAVQIAEDVVVEAGGVVKVPWPQQRAQRVREKYGSDYQKRLAIAAALIAAEIDRLERRRVGNSTPG